MKRLPFAAVLLLGACQREATVQSPAPPPVAANADGRASLPPAAASNRYVGLWAVDAAACADPPWRFEARRLSTRGEVGCAFDAVREVPAGYEIAATCTAQAPPEPHTIKLSFAESAEAMRVEGGPWSEPIALVRCGPPRP